MRERTGFEERIFVCIMALIFASLLIRVGLHVGDEGGIEWATNALATFEVYRSTGNDWLDANKYYGYYALMLFFLTTAGAAVVYAISCIFARDDGPRTELPNPDEQSEG